MWSYLCASRCNILSPSPFCRRKWRLLKEANICDIFSKELYLLNIHPKVDCLMAKLVELRNTDPSIKSVVISQFTSLLSLIEVPLKDQQFSYVRLDGSMSQARRAEVIDTFNKSDPDSPTVFLLSLKAGGVGLNLTAACRVFLLDPVSNSV